MAIALGSPTSRRVSAERAAELVTRTLLMAQRRPGRRGGLNNQHLSELRSALSYYILARFYEQFTQREAEQIAEHAVVSLQARLHAQLSATDLRSLDDPLDQALLRAAVDAACDALLLRRGDSGVQPPLLLGEDQVASAAFGGGATADALRYILCQLAEERRPREFRIVRIYLDLTEKRDGRAPRDQEVAALAEVRQSEVVSALCDVRARLDELGR